MQSRWPDPPCGSRLAVLMRAGLPVVQPETLRYSGSSVFSWFFWIWQAGGPHHAEDGFWRVQGEDTRWVSRGRKATWCPDRQRKSFNYGIGAGSQDRRCVKNRPCDQRRSSLTSESARPGMTGAVTMARFTRSEEHTS